MGSRATSAWVGLVNARQEVSVDVRKASAGPDRRRPRTLGAHLVIEFSPKFPSTRSSTWSRLLTTLTGPRPTLLNKTRLLARIEHDPDRRAVRR
jgi:hypothetical protein